LSHALEERVVHRPEPILVAGALRPRRRHRGARMGAQREVLDDPSHLAGGDESPLELGLRPQRVPLAGRTLEIAELDDHDRRARVAPVPVAGDREARTCGVGRESFRPGPQGHLQFRRGRLGLLLPGRFLAGQQRVDPAREGLDGLGAGEGVGLPRGPLDELEGRRPVEAEALGLAHALLNRAGLAVGGHAGGVGGHVGAGLLGEGGQERGRIRQATPGLLLLEEPLVHLPEACGPLLTEAPGRRRAARRRGV